MYTCFYRFIHIYIYVLYVYYVTCTTQTLHRHTCYIDTPLVKKEKDKSIPYSLPPSAPLPPFSRSLQRGPFGTGGGGGSGPGSVAGGLESLEVLKAEGFLFRGRRRIFFLLDIYITIYLYMYSCFGA